MKKFSRTISGVTPVAVMARPMKCPGQCLYCPTYPTAPQSYTPESPAVIRAIKCGFDAGAQTRMRLQVLSEMGHPTDKIELIVMGGTFLAYPVDYQYEFIKDCYGALNGQPSRDLSEAKRLNESAPHRVTGLCIETRPDWCSAEQVQRMLDFGTTRVELGVQTLSDDIYRLVRRGHLVQDVVEATARLKEHGLKVYYHWMPGLPGATPELDLALSRQLFEDERFRPDGLKLYPTVVVEGTELERWYRQGKYQPYDFDTVVNLSARMKAIVPGYVRISRVLRDIPSKFILAGCRDSLRDDVKKRMKELGLQCRCIRCREYGHRLKSGYQVGPPHLARLDYPASGGREVFLSFEDDHETLFGLLRLRIGEGATALVRELHVFGREVPLNQRQADAAQHKGLGRALLLEAERIAGDEFGAGRLAVLSGPGARGYYREAGYSLEGDYMVKPLACQARTGGTSSHPAPPLP